ncbi:ComF family protein [Ferdinandcohnia quinoae]|uniref:ComF family protein n=1 Tax=Fredinandcohnia quinoae TaxID=2918902 RepID=A0AAW5E4U1_9BACI|nr:ComF family protein [Fredinandcohnia sp. SECRCQ15]MCH1625077.1 ComF family protein [Fredinandcohnia sp. SECRCQ15]
MANCLLCHSYYDEINSWSTLFSLSEPDPVCPTCEGKFESIDGEICTICGRPFSKISTEYREGDLCYDCVRWQNDNRWRDVLQKNRSVFLYNDFGKEIISLYKFRGDYIVSNAFRTSLKHTFRTYYNSSYIIVPIPLSSERLYERGFNQALVLAQLLGKPIHEILSRNHLEKQSKKSRQERMETENVFQIEDRVSVKEKSIILVDDIYTTGLTLRHAAEVLLREGAKSVSALTLMRG